MSRSQQLHRRDPINPDLRAWIVVGVMLVITLIVVTALVPQ